MKMQKYFSACSVLLMILLSSPLMAGDAPGAEIKFTEAILLEGKGAAQLLDLKFQQKPNQEDGPFIRPDVAPLVLATGWSKVYGESHQKVLRYVYESSGQNIYIFGLVDKGKLWQLTGITKSKEPKETGASLFVIINLLEQPINVEDPEFESKIGLHPKENSNIKKDVDPGP